MDAKRLIACANMLRSYIDYAPDNYRRDDGYAAFDELALFAEEFQNAENAAARLPVPSTDPRMKAKLERLEERIKVRLDVGAMTPAMSTILMSIVETLWGIVAPETLDYMDVPKTEDDYPYWKPGASEGELVETPEDDDVYSTVEECPDGKFNCVTCNRQLSFDFDSDRDDALVCHNCLRQYRLLLTCTGKVELNPDEVVERVLAGWFDEDEVVPKPEEPFISKATEEAAASINKMIDDKASKWKASESSPEAQESIKNWLRSKGWKNTRISLSPGTHEDWMYTGDRSLWPAWAKKDRRYVKMYWTFDEAVDWQNALDDNLPPEDYSTVHPGRP